MDTTTTPMTHRDGLVRDPRAKSPALAALLSALPGLGQVYVGATRTGFLHVAVVGGTIALLESGVGALEPLLGLFLAFFWLYNLVDAHQRATQVNLILGGLAHGDLPGTDGGPRADGVLGGALLVVLGLLGLAHQTFGLSLAWLGRWWPAGMVLAGAWLVWRSLSRKPAGPEDTDA